MNQRVYEDRVLELYLRSLLKRENTAQPAGRLGMVVDQQPRDTAQGSPGGGGLYPGADVFPGSDVYPGA